MKDNFSSHAEEYLKFRPTYPRELFEFLLKLVSEKITEWDCGTGNGQVAQELAKYFDKVYATDISEKQIKNSVKRKNIHYKVESAEETSFPDRFFDLITVAQAIHWFDFNQFYKEVRRTLKPNGIIAVIGYGLIQTDDETDSIINNFYNNIIGPYWDKERKYIDENYETIPFPFKEKETIKLTNEFQWTLEKFIGYLQTWSAVQHFVKKKNQNPIDLIYKDLKEAWKGGNTKPVKFPILLRIGQV